MIGKQTTVTTTATLIQAAVNNETRQIQVHSSSANMYFGGDNSVTTANGYLLDSAGGNSLSLTLHPGEALWAICAAGSHTCYTLLSEI